MHVYIFRVRWNKPTIKVSGLTISQSRILNHSTTYLNKLISRSKKKKKINLDFLLKKISLNLNSNLIVLIK